MDHLIDIRCPICVKKLAFISVKDIGIHYLQLKCPRCKIEFFYSEGRISKK